MAARKAGATLDLAHVSKVFKDMAKYSPYVPAYQAPIDTPAPPLRDPKTGALLSRFRYSDSSASVFEEK